MLRVTSKSNKGAGANWAAEEADVTLPDPMLERILGALKASEAENGGAERRVTPRIPMHNCMAIIPFREGVESERINVWIRDISAGGVGLVHGQKMHVGDRFLLEIKPVGQLQHSIHLVCSVVYCEQLSPHLFTIGGRFKRVVADGAK